MKLQGLPASPGVVSGFARRLTTGPDELSVQVPVSATEAGTTAASPDTVPSPVPDRRDSQSPTAAAGARNFAADTSDDCGALGNAHGHVMPANTSLECQADSQGTLSPASRSSSSAPHKPTGSPSQPLPCQDQLSLVHSGPAPNTEGKRFIVVAPTMTARELLRTCQAGAVGVILERCDWNSDTMLLARSLGVPLVCGLGAAGGQIPDQIPVILDGTRGIVSLPNASGASPGDEAFPEGITIQPDFPEPLAAVTRDGITIRVLLTLEFSQKIDPQLLSAADGIGVWRRDRSPGFHGKAGSAAEFLTLYREVAHQLQGQELQIALSLPREHPGASEGQNCVPPETICNELDFPVHLPRDWMIAQVQAILELAKDHPVTILLSQIDSREHLESVLKALGEMAGDRDRGEFPFRVGLLLETPSAAVSARDWLPLVHSLTVDWDGLSRCMASPDQLPNQADPLAICLAPPVLRLLLDLTELARIHGTRLTLCGHLLGEPPWTAVALAIGVRRLSVTPWSFRSAQNTICQISNRGLGELQQLVRTGAPAGEIQNWLQHHMHR